MTLPGSGRHGTVEVELQSTAAARRDNENVARPASDRRCTTTGTTLTELCGRPIIASIYYNLHDRDA